MVYVCEPPSATTVEPLGDTMPFGFWFAIMVNEPWGAGMSANVTAIVWSTVTLVKVYEVDVATPTLSTTRVATVNPLSGAIVNVCDALSATTIAPSGVIEPFEPALEVMVCVTGGVGSSANVAYIVCDA